MSDDSFYTSTAVTGNLVSFRANVHAGLGAARLYSVLVTGGSVTLSQNYDLVLVSASTASVTVSLPPSPTTGDGYHISKYGAGAFNLHVKGNGNVINISLVSVVTLTQWQGWHLRYTGDATIGWFAVNLTGAS